MKVLKFEQEWFPSRLIVNTVMQHNYVSNQQILLYGRLLHDRHDSTFNNHTFSYTLYSHSYLKSKKYLRNPYYSNHNLIFSSLSMMLIFLESRKFLTMVIVSLDRDIYNEIQVPDQTDWQSQFSPDQLTDMINVYVGMEGPTLKSADQTDRQEQNSPDHWSFLADHLIGDRPL